MQSNVPIFRAPAKNSSNAPPSLSDARLHQLHLLAIPTLTQQLGVCPASALFCILCESIVRKAEQLRAFR